MSQSTEASNLSASSGPVQHSDDARGASQPQPNLRQAAGGPSGLRRISNTHSSEQGYRDGGNTESWQDFLRQVAPQDIARRDPNDPIRLAYVQNRYEEARRRRRAMTTSSGMPGSSSSAIAPSSSPSGSVVPPGSSLHGATGAPKRPMSLQFQDRPLPRTPSYTGAEPSAALAPNPSAVPSDEYTLPRWQPDDEVSHCPICGRAFGVFFRRHHCRKCGRVVCASCSPHRITIPRQFIVRPPVELLNAPGGNNRSSMLIDLTHDDGNGDDTDGENGHEGTLSRTDSNPALGGGQEVRLCNPCVPDPNPLPPPSYLSPSGQHFAAGPAEASYDVSGNRYILPPPVPRSTHPYHQSAAQPASTSSRARARQSWAPGASAYDIAAQSSSSSQTFGLRTPFGSAPSESRHNQSNWPFQASPASRPRPTSFFFAHPPRTSSVTDAPLPPTPPPPQPPVREEDECPVCHAALPPKGPNGEETAREAHVSECIASHFSVPSSSRPPPEAALAAAAAASSATPAQARGSASAEGASSGLGRSVSVRRRTTGMVVYPASEKDCVGDDGGEQECVICFEEFAVGDEMGRLECLCKFHRACIRSWWDTKGAGACPVHQDGLGG